MATLPSKSELLAWIRDNPGSSGKREIARAFGIRGSDRIELKRMLRELAADGELSEERRVGRGTAGLAPVAVLRVSAPTADGDLFAHPPDWDGEGAAPRVLFVARRGDPALGEGDRILARLTPVEAEDHTYEGRLIRKIGAAPGRLLGIYRKAAEGGRIVPIDKGAAREWRVRAGDSHNARDGELVEAEPSGPKGRMGQANARVIARLGDPTAPRAVSLIAVHAHGIPDGFPDDVLAEAGCAAPAGAGDREDLRNLSLITIDPADARDRDDAVFAVADGDPANAGGHVVWVAIADVAHYVRPDTLLDREARKRGNSTYFPDRVVPMLPDRLSGDLCSLHERVERPCIAVRMVLDASGEKLSHRFTRGLMCSRAALTYAEVQAARDGTPGDKTAPLVADVIAPLYAAYAAVRKARDKRQPLNLDLPERRIELTPEGRVSAVAFRERLDAHRLVEEFMILANVAAAETLEEGRRPLLYRVHEAPSPEKLDALRDVAEAAGLVLAKGQALRTVHLNRLLDQAAGTDHAGVLNISVLRAMTQAYYVPKNLGHFGLNLRRYAHFTSPIRRYADLVVHRALIAAHGWGDDGLTQVQTAQLPETAEHISQTERRSMAAERDTVDRYLAAYLSERVGNEFEGRISGIARFGVFVRLIETGADGLIPISTLGREYFHYDRERQTLSGEHSGLTLGLGTRVTVRLAEAVPVTGGLMLEMLEVAGTPMTPNSRGRARGGKRGGKGGARGRRKQVQAGGKARKPGAAPGRGAR